MGGRGAVGVVAVEAAPGRADVASRRTDRRAVVRLQSGLAPRSRFPPAALRGRVFHEEKLSVGVVCPLFFYMKADALALD